MAATSGMQTPNQIVSEMLKDQTTREMLQEFFGDMMAAQEKRDEQITKLIRCGTVDSRNKRDITQKRLEIPPVPTKDVIPPAESDDEDNERDLQCRRRLFLKKARRVASEKRAKGRALLEALERPGISHLQVQEVLELADGRAQARPAPLRQPPDEPFIIPESPLV